jgi:uncharacterized protein YprB with RNaseH-like and TPR domain
MRDPRGTHTLFGWDSHGDIWIFDIKTVGLSRYDTHITMTHTGVASILLEGMP